MTTQTVLLLICVCVGEELRQGSSLIVSSSRERVHLPTTAQGSLEHEIDFKSRENAVSSLKIKEQVDHGQKNKFTPDPEVPVLKDEEKRDQKIVERSIDERETSVTPESPHDALSRYSTPQTTFTPRKIWNMFTSKSEARVVNTVHTLVALESMDGDPSIEGSHRMSLQTDLHLDSDVLPERRSSFVVGLVSEDVGAGLRLEGAGLRMEGAGLRLEGAKPHSRRRRSWLWNQFFVIEEYRGPEPVLIGRLHTDMDRGDGRTTYVLEGEGVGSVFVIDGQTGNIHVTKSLDREEKDQYRLVATATDRQTGRALEPSSQFIIRVQDINDNPPVFRDEPYSATVPEMANIGTSIIQVTATDADDPTYGNSARLVYTVTQGQEYFSVDPQTGVLRTAVPDMDRETQDAYMVVLEAKDMGGHLGGMSGTTTVTVRLSDINDNPPRFAKSVWSFSVSELAAPGVEVGRLSATDADQGENALLTYSITDGEERETFNITPGRDKEAVIVLNKLLDYESRSSFSFSVEVVNPIVDARFLRRGPFKDRATVRVTVLNADEPPRFSRSRYRLDVSENCPPVCSVGRVAAVDPDTGQSTNIRYSIDPQSDPEALFRIASDNGLITAVMELDREREQWHNISVIAAQRDNPNLVTRVVVAIETLDQNDNAPELDRQYTTSVCDSSAPGQVVQVVRAIDKDQGGQDTTVHFSIPPESSSALNLTIRESGGATASLVLQSALQLLPGFSSSLLTLYVPIVLRDGASGLTNTGTVTVTVCPCLSGGMRAEERGRQRDRGWERHTMCLPLPSSSPSLIFSMVTLLALLACVTTLLVVCALSLSLRHQKRDSLSPFEEDDVRENIITYDDEGGGEADTAAFDIAALQSMHRVQRMQDTRNIWYTQQNQPRARTYSCSRNPRSALDPRRPGSAPVYGRLCYNIHTLPVLPDCQEGPLQVGGLQLTHLTYGHPGNPMANSQVIQNQGSFDLLQQPGAAPIISPVETCCSSSVDGPGNTTAHSSEKEERGGEGISETQQNQDQEPNRTQPESNEELILTYPDLNGTSTQTHSSSSSEQQGGQSEPTLAHTAAPCSAVDDIDSSSPLVSMKNQNDISQIDGFQMPANPPGDTYSIVGSLNQGGGGIPVTGTTCGLYSGGAELLDMYALGRRDLTPQILPLPVGVMGYGRGWGPGRHLVSERGGADSLPLRMEEFLKFRLDQVTFDLSQPPYDSLQTYEFEGGNSRAESLSSLESEGEREEEREREGGVNELDQKFHRLVELIEEREREKEKEKKSAEDETSVGDQDTDANDTSGKEGADREKEENRWDF